MTRQMTRLELLYRISADLVASASSAILAGDFEGHSIITAKYLATEEAIRGAEWGDENV